MKIPGNDRELRLLGLPDTWDNTMRSLISYCPRKLYWFLRGLESYSRPAYFTFGAAFQEALVQWYDTQLEHGEESSPEFEACARLSVQRALAFWDEEERLFGVTETGKDNRLLLRQVFTAYVHHYPTEPFVVLGSEQGWVWPIEGTPYYMGGSLDGDVDYPPWGLMPMETKTSSNYLGQGYVKSWNHSAQVSGYIWYMKQLRGDEAGGCLMNLCTKKIPGPNANWSTPRFERIVVHKTDAQLEDFIKGFKHDLAVVEMLWSKWEWPMTGDGKRCYGGPGMATCGYLSMCSCGRDFRDLEPGEFGFRVRLEPWEPWRRKGNEEV